MSLPDIGMQTPIHNFRWVHDEHAFDQHNLVHPVRNIPYCRRHNFRHADQHKPRLKLGRHGKPWHCQTDVVGLGCTQTTMNNIAQITGFFLVLYSNCRNIRLVLDWMATNATSRWLTFQRHRSIGVGYMRTGGLRTYFNYFRWEQRGQIWEVPIHATCS
jgi:hypothetical protein